MASLIVQGDVPLNGSIEVRGAKNLVSKAMVAALLGDTPSRLRNVPDIRDVHVVTGLLCVHGVEVKPGREAGSLVMDPSNAVRAHVADIDAHAGASRIPILFCGPLLHLLGEAVIPDLGGCRIGDRPINFHLDVLRQFGAEVEKRENGIYITAPSGLAGSVITLPYPSVGATEQVLLSGVKASGTTVLHNAAVEPEIMDLICVLQKMGAIITVGTGRTIRIEGVREMRGYSHRACSDRMEAGSWACAALATRGDVYVRGAHQQDMMTFLNVYRTIGGAFDVDDDGIRFFHSGEPLRSMAMETDVHPGFMTDWQQPMVVVLTQAEGLSIIHETVYENRFGFTDALNKMGAHIQTYRDCLGPTPCRFGQRNFRHSAVISGPRVLHGAHIEVPDLRGGFSHLIGALTARGESVVDGIELVDRGYEQIIHKLTSLGARFSMDVPASEQPNAAEPTAQAATAKV